MMTLILLEIFENFENSRRNDIVNLILRPCKVEWRFEASIFISTSWNFSLGFFVRVLREAGILGSSEC